MVVGRKFYMSYINIPYVVENNRIGKDLVEKELRLLDLSENARAETMAAIYSIRPRGVELTEPAQAIELKSLLMRLGIPHRQTDVSEYS
jgi:hypothetical protein